MQGVFGTGRGTPPRWQGFRRNQRRIAHELRLRRLVSTVMDTAPFPMSQSVLEQGRAFLAENAQKPGITTTASGLQYEVLIPGTGKSPKLKDTVVVNYRGTLLNGVEFDSSYLAGRESAEFPLKRVIKGWKEGVQLMQEGAKFRFFIPSELAYGKRGSGIDIGPNETLIFEVELLKVWED